MRQHTHRVTLHRDEQVSASRLNYSSEKHRDERQKVGAAPQSSMINSLLLDKAQVDEPRCKRLQQARTVPQASPPLAGAPYTYAPITTEDAWRFASEARQVEATNPRRASQAAATMKVMCLITALIAAP